MNLSPRRRQRPANSSAALLLSLLLPVAGLATGCGAKGQPPEAKVPPKEKLPPVPPPPREVARDEALRLNAKRTINDIYNSSSDEFVRSHAIEAAKDSMGAEATPIVLRGLSDESYVVRFAAAAAAGDLKLAEAREGLTKLLRDPQTVVQVAAVYGLHKLGDTRYSQNLMRYVNDPRKEVRANVVMLLGRMGEPSAIPTLRRLRNDPDPGVRIQASEGLWRLGDDVGLQDLVAATVSPFKDEQVIGLLGLAGPKDSRVLGHITGKLAREHSDYYEVNLAAARAAGELGSDEGYAVAIDGLKGPDPRIRVLAALALGAIGRRDAQDSLRPLLGDTDPDVRLATATAILQLH